MSPKRFPGLPSNDLKKKMNRTEGAELPYDREGMEAVAREWKREQAEYPTYSRPKKKEEIYSA